MRWPVVCFCVQISCLRLSALLYKPSVGCVVTVIPRVYPSGQLVDMLSLSTGEEHAMAEWIQKEYALYVDSN